MRPPRPRTPGIHPGVALGCPRNPSTPIFATTGCCPPGLCLPKDPNRGADPLRPGAVSPIVLAFRRTPHWRPRMPSWESRPASPMAVVNLTGNTWGTCGRRGMPGLRLLYKMPTPSPNQGHVLRTQEWSKLTTLDLCCLRKGMAWLFRPLMLEQEEAMQLETGPRGGWQHYLS